MTAEILIVDDEEGIRTLVQGILEDEGYSIRQAANAKQAYARIEEHVPDLLILDIWLQNSEHDGLEILKTVKEQRDDLPVLMISGHGTIETAVTALKHGAYDFIEKPFKTDRLLLMIERALETAKLKRENAALREKAEGAVEFVGESPVVTSLKQVIKRVAPTNSRVLITGEPGTGKDLIARMIHKQSERATKPFVVLNCATMRPEHLEAELFGTVRDQTGLLEQADGGTLFLDEVSDMPMETQGKIVRVLQEQRFQRVGGHDELEVDVRILASTNRDLQTFIAKGTFRQDLFYRLNVVPIHVPALRERTKDIRILAEFFVSMYARQYGFQERSFSPSALAALQSYEWPGNVRQLKNAVEWLMIMKPEGDRGQGNVSAFIDLENLPPEISNISSSKTSSDDSVQDTLINFPLREAREQFERDYLMAQVNRFKGNISKTAQFVGMERSALHRKLKSLNINSDQTKDKQKA